MRWAVFEFSADRLQDTSDIPKHIVVLEPDDSITMFCQSGGALVILGDPIRMLAAIEFDHKLRVEQAKSAIYLPIGH